MQHYIQALAIKEFCLAVMFIITLASYIDTVHAILIMQKTSHKLKDCLQGSIVQII